MQATDTDTMNTEIQNRADKLIKELMEKIESKQKAIVDIGKTMKLVRETNNEYLLDILETHSLSRFRYY